MSDKILKNEELTRKLERLEEKYGPLKEKKSHTKHCRCWVGTGAGKNNVAPAQLLVVEDDTGKVLYDVEDDCDQEFTDFSRQQEFKRRTTTDRDKKIEKIASRLWDSHVFANITDIGPYLFGGFDDETKYDEWSEWWNIYDLTCPTCGKTSPKDNWKEKEKLVNDEPVGYWICPACGAQIEHMSRKKQRRHINEYFIVSKSLAQKLSDLGEPVYMKRACPIWGKTTSDDYGELTYRLHQDPYIWAIAEHWLDTEY